MFFGLFGSKKPKPLPFSSKKTPLSDTSLIFLEDNQRLQGDIETHTFNHSLTSIKYSFYLTNASNIAPSKVNPDPSDILNERVIEELLKKYPLVMNKEVKEDREEVKELESSISVKQIRASLNLIIRYNNTRELKERQGFASSLSDRAEEIGASNTIKFLLNVIDKQLVNFLIIFSHMIYLTLSLLCYLT